MSDVRERLSRLASEPARRLDLDAVERRARQLHRRSRVALSTFVALPLALALAVLLLFTVGRPSTTRLRTTAPSSSTVLAAPHAYQAAGFDVSSGWRIDDGQFQRSSNGSSWISDPLPQSVSAANIQAVTTEATGPAVVVTEASSGLTVYSQTAPSSAWRTVAVTPEWPSRFGGPTGSRISESGPFVALAMSDSGGSSSALEDVMTSSNDGATFQQIMSSSGFGLVWQSLAFINSSDGVVVEGPASEDLDFSSNGGASWSPANVPSSVSGDEFGTVEVVDGTFVVPAYQLAADGSETISILASSSGATFALEGTPITLDSAQAPNYANIALSGSSIWVFTSTDVIYESTDSGRRWSAVTAPGLPADVSSASLFSATDGAVAIDETDCESLKSDCTDSVGTFVTTDSGKTWMQT